VNEAALAWRHAFKLDPERSIDEEALERICLSGSDGIIVGGSSGVTYENTVDLLSRIRRYEMPCVLEVSVMEAIVPGFNAYLIPMVLNTHNADWIIGRHQQALRRFGKLLPWDKLIVEGYIILNPDSTAARVTEAYIPKDDAEIHAMAELADRLLKLPIIYMEYSGTYGDIKLVRSIRDKLKQARLVYGGGISSAEQATEAGQAADMIIVGNLIYTDLDAALITVEAAKAISSITSNE
jgi:putative glycerol-1-phosphate prenyltransferase